MHETTPGTVTPAASFCLDEDTGPPRDQAWEAGPSREICRAVTPSQEAGVHTADSHASRPHSPTTAFLQSPGRCFSVAVSRWNSSA